MTPERRERISELFEAALEQEPSHRDAFLAGACDDEEIRAEVKSLLSEHERVGGFMRDPVLGPVNPSSPQRSTLSAISEVALRKISERYDVLAEVGRGGMGIVYRARDRETDELVALKILRPEIASDERVMERFKNELRLARKITHKNVCRIHEFSRTDGTSFISMEFVDGDSLRHILNRFGTISLRKGIQIAQQICAGLREAHAQGIIHRDLKPENLMLDHAGQVKIMDFGIARSIEAGTTNTGSIIGTPAYMAPEQAEGKAVDRRSDIYSLGLILYEMFTGSAAFSGDTAMAVALKQVREKPTPPRELDSSIPEVVENLILKCVEKDPAKRFQSVQELEIELTKVGEFAGPRQHKTFGPRTRPHELETRMRPRASAAMLACAFAAGSVAASVVAWAWMIRHPPVSPWHDAAIIALAFSPDGQFLVTTSEDKTVRLWEVKTRRLVRTFAGHTRAVETVEFTPDGRWLASGGLDKTIRIWEIVTGRELRILAGHSMGVQALAFNFDGSRLASGDGDGKVKVWDPVAGRDLFDLVAHREAVSDLAFSPDGRILATSSSDETIKLWEFPSSRLRLTITGHSDEVTAVAFSPDGRWLASGSYDKTIKLWEVATGQELRTLIGHEDPVVDVAFSPDGRSLASASDDGTVRIWDAITGQQVRILKGHEGSVTTVAFSPDGRWLASGGADRTVRIWDIENGRPIN